MLANTMIVGDKSEQFPHFTKRPLVQRFKSGWLTLGKQISLTCPRQIAHVQWVGKSPAQEKAWGKAVTGAKA